MENEGRKCVSCNFSYTATNARYGCFGGADAIMAIEGNSNFIIFIIMSNIITISFVPSLRPSELHGDWTTYYAAIGNGPALIFLLTETNRGGLAFVMAA